MIDKIFELFLSAYFLFMRIGGKLIDDDRAFFDKLYSAFLLPEKDKTTLYALSHNEAVRDISTYSDFAQVCRIQKYSELNGYDMDIQQDIMALISIKGGALFKAKQVGYDECAVGTETGTCKILSDMANMGFIAALNMLGMLQCEGIFVDKSRSQGVKNIDKAAQWNSIEGCMLALHYDEAHRALNLDRLYTVTNGTLYRDLYVMATAAYGAHDGREIYGNKLLKKAFAAATLKPDLYDAKHARFIFSEILGDKDKTRALFSGHKEVVSETADLPLKLGYGELCFDSTPIDELPLVREKERARICDTAFNIDLRRDTAYRPLCVCAESEYQARLYMTAIGKAFKDAHVERMDVADLNDYDFEPTKNNIFVRSCDEHKQNVYILNFRGEIRDGVMTVVKNFLQSDKRRKFRLLQPAAEIDLSSILPICFCDKQSVRELRSICDVVTIAPLSAEEKLDLIPYVLKSKTVQYKMNGVCADDQAVKLLSGYSIDGADGLIDRAVRFNRAVGTLTITVDMLKDMSGGEYGKKSKYGFGDANNEGN